MNHIKTKQNILALIREAEERFAGTGKALLDIEDYVAEYLTAKGVIVPPCKVGDKYVMDSAKTLFEAWNDVTGAVDRGLSWYYELESVIEDIVKLSFGSGVLYREEAEQALKGGKARC